MTKVIEDLLINHFIDEAAKDDTWRMFRQDTFLDLINVELANYLLKPTNEALIKSFNYCLKAQILNKIKLSDDIDIDSGKFGKDLILLKVEYNHLSDLLKELSEKDRERFNNISEITNYIKVVSSLNISYYKAELFNQIAICVFNTLTTRI